MRLYDKGYGEITFTPWQRSYHADERDAHTRIEFAHADTAFTTRAGFWRWGGGVSLNYLWDTDTQTVTSAGFYAQAAPFWGKLRFKLGMRNVTTYGLGEPFHGNNWYLQLSITNLSDMVDLYDRTK